MSSVYSNMTLFDDQNLTAAYSEMNGDFAKYSNAKNLIVDYLCDYPRNKITRSFFKSMVSNATVAGICCSASNDQDTEILDGLFGYIDIPAGMDGLVCDLVRISKTSTYFFVYDNSRVGQYSVRHVNISRFGFF